ncbi:hypothetical protein ACFPTO_23095 [Paraburkholderia denitrificans]|uniref:Four helix bundle protein n=1 Tax=Paraburkholderia denitrificans TaxID=694025 RepID=A0ABW0JF63_9BURK
MKPEDISPRLEVCLELVYECISRKKFGNSQERRDETVQLTLNAV